MISAVLVVSTHTKQIKQLKAQSQAKTLIKKRKTSVLLTVAIMQFGFTVSLSEYTQIIYINMTFKLPGILTYINVSHTI